MSRPPAARFDGGINAHSRDSSLSRGACPFVANKLMANKFARYLITGGLVLAAGFGVKVYLQWGPHLRGADHGRNQPRLPNRPVPSGAKSKNNVMRPKKLTSGRSNSASPNWRRRGVHLKSLMIPILLLSALTMLEMGQLITNGLSRAQVITTKHERKKIRIYKCGDGVYSAEILVPGFIDVWAPLRGRTATRFSRARMRRSKPQARNRPAPLAEEECKHRNR
jgi:hypothetical protein